MKYLIIICFLFFGCYPQTENQPTSTDSPRVKNETDKTLIWNVVSPQQTWFNSNCSELVKHHVKQVDSNEGKDYIFTYHINGLVRKSDCKGSECLNYDPPHIFTSTTENTYFFKRKRKTNLSEGCVVFREYSYIFTDAGFKGRFTYVIKYNYTGVDCHLYAEPYRDLEGKTLQNCEVGFTEELEFSHYYGEGQ